jgi:hypothetical protein
VTSGNVNLGIDVAGARGNQIGVNYGGRIQWDGEFTIAQRRRPAATCSRARGDDREDPQYADAAGDDTGEDLERLTVVLAPGATITGAVTFSRRPGAAGPVAIPHHRAVADQSDVGPQPNAPRRQGRRLRVERRPGRVAPDSRAGNSRAFILKSVTVTAATSPTRRCGCAAARRWPTSP